MFASVLAAPQDREGKWLGAHHAVVGAHPAVVNAHPVVGAAQVVNVAHHTVAAPRVGTAPLQIAAPLPAPHLTQQKLPDQTVVHKPEPIITKKVHLGQTTYVSGYATQILKPAIPDFKIAGKFFCLLSRLINNAIISAISCNFTKFLIILFFSVPTALKGTVSHNAPIVHVEKEIHTVNQPVHVEKPYEVPYDVIKHVEKIIEVPTPVHVSVPVPVEVPHPVLGKNFIVINIIEKNICIPTYLNYTFHK